MGPSLSIDDFGTGYFYARPLPAVEFAPCAENHHGKLDQRAA